MGLLRVNTSTSNQTQELLTGPTVLHQYDGNNDVNIRADYDTADQSPMIIFIPGEPASLIRRAGEQEM